MYPSQIIPLPFGVENIKQKTIVTINNRGAIMHPGWPVHVISSCWSTCPSAPLSAIHHASHARARSPLASAAGPSAQLLTARQMTGAPLCRDIKQPRPLPERWRSGSLWCSLGLSAGEHCPWPSLCPPLSLSLSLTSPPPTPSARLLSAPLWGFS